MAGAPAEADRSALKRPASGQPEVSLDRRRFLGTLGGSLVAAPVGAWVQPRAANPVPTVGILHPGRRDPTLPSVEALPRLAAERVGLNVDVLYVSGPPAMRAAVAASRTVPIVGDNLPPARSA